MAAVTRELSGAGYRIELDLTPQVLLLSIPEEKSWGTLADLKAGRMGGKEEPLAPTPRDTAREFVSASMLAVKAKLFDDGLYAAVELAAQEGAGTFAGKAKLLGRLVRVAPEIAAAAALGGLDAPLDEEARGIREGFLANELLSKPLGFYTWSDPLRRIFQQDRLLQQELPPARAQALTHALREEPWCTNAYGQYLDLVARLTNPLVTERPDLRRPDGRFFFPPSRAHETDLVKRLFGDTPIPEGFSLADEMIRRIRDGSLSLQPTPDSGWYDWQAWALEPLVVPERAEEATRLRLNDRYRRQLEDLFKAVIALTRETHVKQLEIPMSGAALGGREERPVWVSPDLTVEPLVTYYERRAAGYDFVREALEAALGVLPTPLDQELEQTTALFRGAAAVARRQLGIPARPDASEARFDAWCAAPDDDAADVRMMVPVFFDVGRQQTKVWAILGWSTRDLHVGFATPPAARVIEGRVRVEFSSDFHALSYPVFAETYVTRLLDRDEFRAHCDRYKTRTEILAHL